MKRLTTDHPDGNFETALNFVYGKDGVAYLRSDGEQDDVPLHEWAKRQCVARGCDEFPGETMEEIDETICDCGFDFPDCPVHLAYTFACQAVHLRDRLKMYEDIGMFPEQIKEWLAMLPPPCYKPDGDGCAYQVYDGDDEPIDRCKECPLCFNDKQRHQQPNAPLTLKELREMDGDAVWICDPDGSDGMWALVDLEYELCRTAKGGLAIFETYSKTWLSYRRKPEEAI